VMDAMMWGMGLWGLLLIIVLLAVLVFVVLGSVWLLRHLRQSDSGTLDQGSIDSAREVLRRRYAGGEIDDEEYERRLTALTWQ